MRHYGCASYRTHIDRTHGVVMLKTQKRVIITLVIALSLILLFNIGKKIFFHFFFANYKPPAVSVSTTTVQAKTWIPEIRAVGLFKAVRGVEISTEAAGKITSINFESGQYVQQDDPLIEIDDTVEQANLKFHRADLALQTVNYKRQKDLQAKRATADVTVDEAEAKLLEAQAKVEETEALIRQKHIRAPFSGQIGLRQIDFGEYVSPGKTIVATLQTLDPLFVEFNLPEQLLTHVSIGQTIFSGLPQYPNTLFKGKISAINSKADTQTHNIKVQATFPNCPRVSFKKPSQDGAFQFKESTDHRIRYIECSSEFNTQTKVSSYAFIPGMFVSILIEQPPKNQTLVLPSTAISYSLYGNSVFVIEKIQDKKDRTHLAVKQVFVRTGETQGNETVILEGLKKGDEVVSSGELKLQNGTSVIINNEIKIPTEQTVRE